MAVIGREAARAPLTSADINDGIVGAADLQSTLDLSSKTITMPSISSLDVTGNLTVDTNTLYVDATNNRVGIGTTSPSTALHVDNNSTGEQARLSSSSSNGTTFGFRNTATNGRNYRIGNNFVTGQGEFAIYDDTGSASRLLISSSGNVGIGTTSPDSNSRLDVQGGRAYFSSDDEFTLRLSTANNGAVGKYIGTPAGDTLAFYSNTGGEEARIDSSGNLLVGKSASNTTSTAGNELGASGYAMFVRANDVSLFACRTGSDGNIANFVKDGTTVGSIGSVSGLVSYITLDPRSGGTGIGGTNTDSIVPVTGTGTFANGTKDLGLSTARWRDLYLSGGVYLGGTGAANLLDDYETGTWTPAINVGTMNATSAKYTRIGDVVTVHASISDISNNASSSNIQISGLPFTSGSATSATGSAMFRYFSKTNSTQMTTYIGSNDSYLVFYWSFDDGSTSWAPVEFQDGAQANMDIIFTLTYRVA